jgi:hypothetical protein
MAGSRRRKNISVVRHGHRCGAARLIFTVQKKEQYSLLFVGQSILRRREGDDDGRCGFLEYSMIPRF